MTKMWGLYKSKKLGWWSRRKKRALVAAMRKAYANTKFRKPLESRNMTPADEYRRSLAGEILLAHISFFGPRLNYEVYEAYLDLLYEEQERVTE